MIPLSFKLQYHYYLMKAFLKKLGKLRFWSITSESYTCKDTRRFISTVKKEDSPPSVVGYIGDLFVDLDFIGFVLVLFFWFLWKMECLLRLYSLFLGYT